MLYLTWMDESKIIYNAVILVILHTVTRVLYPLGFLCYCENRFTDEAKNHYIHGIDLLTYSTPQYFIPRL